MNAFIVNLRKSDIGSYFKNVLWMSTLCRHVLLMCPSIKGLQLTLDICSHTADDLSLQFICSKLHCMVVGKAAAVKLHNIYLGDTHILWSQTVKYMGVHTASGKVCVLMLIP